MKVYIQKSCFVLVAISMLYTVFPVPRVDAKAASSATANMTQVPFPKAANPVKASQYSAAYVAVPSVNCWGMSIRACEAAHARARPRAAQAGPRLAEIRKPTPLLIPSFIKTKTQVAASKAAKSTVAKHKKAAARPVATTVPARPVATTVPARPVATTVPARPVAATVPARPVAATVPAATNAKANPDTNCNKLYINIAMRKICDAPTFTEANATLTQNLGIVNNFPSNSANICGPQQINNKNKKDCFTEKATSVRIAGAVETLNSAISSKAFDQTTVIVFEGYNTAAAGSGTDNKKNATTRAISSAAQACGNGNPPVYSAVDRLNVIERTTATCAIFYISAGVVGAKRDAIEAKCIAAATAANLACAIAQPRQDATNNNFNRVGLRATTASLRTIITPPAPINVCSRATRTLIIIAASNYSDALYYRPTNGSCGTPHGDPVPDVPAGQNDTPAASRGQNDTPAASRGQNDTPAVSGGQDGASGGNDTPYYSDWPDYTLDPSTDAPWVVEVRVVTTAPTYYVANGKKTSLRHTVQVLCGAAKEMCTEGKHGIEYTPPKITVTQSTDDPKFVACASPKGTKCAYYAPKNKEEVILNNGNTTSFDIYFYTPLPLEANALTTLAVDVTVDRIIKFANAAPVTVEVDDVKEMFYVNGAFSTNNVISSKVLGSRG